MSDLISRKAFLKFLEDRHIKYSIEWMVQNYSASTIYSMVERAPAVDAVEVVRCKDCKHSFLDDENNCCCDCLDGLLGLVRPNDFCSHGERTDDE